MTYHSGMLDIESIAKCKEDLVVANKRLKAVYDNLERDYNTLTEQLCQEEKSSTIVWKH